MSHPASMTPHTDTVIPGPRAAGLVPSCGPSPIEVSVVVPVHNERTANPNLLAEACRQANPKAETIEFASLSQALLATEAEALTVVAGSLYLIGEAMEFLHLSAAKSEQERKLNEWGPPRGQW